MTELIISNLISRLLAGEECVLRYIGTDFGESILTDVIAELCKKPFFNISLNRDAQTLTFMNSGGELKLVECPAVPDQINQVAIRLVSRQPEKSFYTSVDLSNESLLTDHFEGLASG